jgi:hypothetical protein
MALTFRSIRSVVLCLAAVCSVVDPSPLSSSSKAAVPVGFEQSIIVSLYSVGKTDHETNRELQYDQMVNYSMSCFDVTNSSGSVSALQSVVRKAFTFHVMDGGVTDDDGSGSGSAENGQNDQNSPDNSTQHTDLEVTVPLVARLSFESGTSGSVKIYHVQHIATLARMMANQPSTPSVKFTFYEPGYLVRVKLVDSIDHLSAPWPVNTEHTLRLVRVRDACRALLNDYDCVHNRIDSFLPHSTDEFRQCIDTWLHNMVMYHSFFPLPDVRINATAIANPCFAEVLATSSSAVLTPPAKSTAPSSAGTGQQKFGVPLRPQALLFSGYSMNPYFLRTIKCFHDSSNVEQKNQTNSTDVDQSSEQPVTTVNPLDPPDPPEWIDVRSVIEQSAAQSQADMYMDGTATNGCDGEGSMGNTFMFSLALIVLKLLSLTTN